MTKEEYETDLANARIARAEYEANCHWNKQDARYRFAASLLFAHAENERLRARLGRVSNDYAEANWASIQRGDGDLNGFKP